MSLEKMLPLLIVFAINFFPTLQSATVPFDVKRIIQIGILKFQSQNFKNRDFARFEKHCSFFPTLAPFYRTFKKT